MRRVWLASYPKSGNTWMRLLAAGLWLKDGETLDINDLPGTRGIASARAPFEYHTLIDSSLLTHDEIDALRPAVHEAQARGDEEAESIAITYFVKTHDAYTRLPGGAPLLAGRAGADGAILIVRDPRGVAPSFANHNNSDIDKIIARMADPEGCMSGSTAKLDPQIRQRLLGWSAFNASWLDQDDLPILTVRYEDMIADTASALSRVIAFVGLASEPDKIARAVAAADFAELVRQEAEVGFREAPRKMSTARFFRRGEAFAWEEELSEEQIERIESVHGAMMRRLGYALLSDVEKRASHPAANPV